MTEHTLSDLMLEQYLLGELPGNQIKKIESAIEENKNLQQRLESIKKSNQDILSLYPAEKMAKEIEHRFNYEEKIKKINQEKKRYSFYRTFTIIAPVCSAALFLLLFTLPKHQKPDTRIKGTPSIQVFRQVKGAENERMKENMIAHQNDSLQIRILPKGAKYGIIFSIDGNKAVTLHFPASPGHSQQLGKEAFNLPESYQLDNAPLFEKFYFITSKESLDLRDIISKANELALNPDKVPATDLELDKGIKQYSILLLKD